MKTICIFCITLLGFSTLWAQGPRDSLSLRNIHPFTGVLQNTAHAFWGWNGLLQLSALGLTPVLVQSGADREVHNYFVNHQALHPFTIPAVWGTYLMPAALTGGLYTYGRMQNAPREVAAACAVVQATGVSFVYQTLLKSVTGRPSPQPRAMSQAEVEEFPFGFLEGGIHYGWPSGHMMTTTSILMSLQMIYPESQSLRWGSTAYLGYVFGSVLLHEQAHMHYLYEAVAGTLMGLAIGRAVGGGFAAHSGKPAQQAKYSLLPQIGAANGLTIQARF